MLLAQSVYLLKNIKTLLFFKAELNSGFLRFMRRYHRYRIVGVPAVLWEHFPEAEMRAPFVCLEVPEEELLGWRSGLGDAAHYAVTLASRFATPICVPDEGLLEEFTHLEVARLMAEQSPDPAETLRHMRIAAYSMVDFMRDAPSWVERLQEGGREAILRSRKEALLSDAQKRYWRLGVDEGGVAWASLLDPLKGGAAPYPEPFSILCGFVVVFVVKVE